MTVGRKPGGTNRGTRIKLTLQTKFLEALEKDFQEHGLAAIRITRIENPEAYLRIVASVLPRELVLAEEPLQDMSDQELLEALSTIRKLRNAEKQEPAPCAPENSKLH